MKSKIWYYAAGVAVLLAVVFVFASGASDVKASVIDDTATVYKDPDCSCCGIYTAYLKDKVKDVNLVMREDMEPFKRQEGVPAQIESCHTMVIGNYFVEGHVPIEAVRKLMEEKPDIKGIALAGMPSGAPGMPGAKAGTWTVYAVNNDGSYVPFMEI